MYYCFIDTRSYCTHIGLKHYVQLAPPCWVMPHQYAEFASATTNLEKGNKLFFIKPVSSSGWRSRLVNLEKPEDINYTKRSSICSKRIIVCVYAICLRFQQHSGIIQYYFSNQLFISDKPFSMRVFILVTSMSPLRAYMYNEGVVYFRTSQRKSHHRVCSKLHVLLHFRFICIIRVI